MRKTLFAMLGLVALGLWALPAVAAPVAGGQVVDGPKMRPDPVSLENRAGAIGLWFVDIRPGADAGERALAIAALDHAGQGTLWPGPGL